jgi:hypothetical protein
MSSLRTLVLWLSVGWVSTSSAQAALIINFAEVGGDVVATLSGSLNVSGIRQIDEGTVVGSQVVPGNGLIQMAPAGGDPSASWSRAYNVIDSPAALIFGTGPAVSADHRSGDVFLLMGADNFFTLPYSYHGGPLNGSMTFLGKSFVSLGTTPGVYTSTIGGGQDRITITFGSAAVPEPATLGLMSVAFAALGCHTWRRRRSALA